MSTKVGVAVFERSFLRSAIALLVLAAIVAVCVSPAVDLDDCALRSRRVAAVFYWLLASVLVLLVITFFSPFRRLALGIVAEFRQIFWDPPASFAIVDLTCVRLI